MILKVEREGVRIDGRFFNRKYVLDDEVLKELRRLYIDEKLSTTEISRGWNVDQTTICNWMKIGGIRSRTISESKKLSVLKKSINWRRNIDTLIYGWSNKKLEEWLKKKYLVEELSQVEISKLIGWKDSTGMKSLLKGFKIPLRTWREMALNEWKDQDYVRKQKESRNLKPNLFESKLYEFLEKILPRNYKYVGDFSYSIGGRNPDFIHRTQNKVIEAFGDYWHGQKFLGKSKEEHEKERIEGFKKFGYDTLIVWESELKDLEQLRKKVLEFNE